MDWVGTLSTAVVGLAGIVATVWGSASSQRHQSRRAEIDEKRRVYANLFARADQVVLAIRRVRTLRDAEPDDATLNQAIERMRELRQDFNTAMYELQLICPPKVQQTSEELRVALRDRANRAEIGDGDDFSVRDTRHRLVDLMRADLGYPVSSEPPTSSASA
jgi:hypothetical protein